MKKCIVIGGGVVGLSSAYYLAKAGHSVTVVDAGDMEDGCSYGNAGMIVPSHLIPLAQPGMINQGIKWMLKSSSPFYVRPRLSSDLLSWGRSFKKYATANHVNESKSALLDLSLFSKDLFQDLAREGLFGYEEKGLLMLFQSEHVAEEERAAAELAQEMGLDVDFLNQEETKDLESGIEINAIGSIHYRSDAHLDPIKFMTFLKTKLEQLGVRLLKNSPVSSFKISSGKIEACVCDQTMHLADEFVLAAGSWSPILAKQLGIKIQILPGKGYSFNETLSNSRPTIPSVLCEGKVAVTPMGDKTRFGGTLEITTVKDEKINKKRVEGIVDTINRFYPNLKINLPAQKDIWFGYRPCTPSGLPIISKHNQYSNLTIAAGHAMMGLSMGPGTGKLVSELISEKKASIGLELFTQPAN